MLRHGLEQRIHQRHVDHRGLVDDEQVAVERVLLVAREAAVLRVDLQQAVDGLGLKAGLLGHALGGAAGRCGERDLHALGRQNAQDRVERAGLSDARPARDDRDLGAEHQAARASRCEGERVLPVRLSTQGSALSRSISGQGGVPDARSISRSAMVRSAACRPLRKTQVSPPTVSAMTLAARRSRSAIADRIRSASTSSSRSARPVSCSMGRPQWPSSMAVWSAKETPARSRCGAVFSMPSFDCDGVGRAKADAAYVSGQPIRVLAS